MQKEVWQYSSGIIDFVRSICLNATSDKKYFEFYLSISFKEQTLRVNRIAIAKCYKSVLYKQL